MKDFTSKDVVTQFIDSEDEFPESELKVLKALFDTIPGTIYENHMIPLILTLPRSPFLAVVYNFICEDDALLDKFNKQLTGNKKCQKSIQGICDEFTNLTQEETRRIYISRHFGKTKVKVLDSVAHHMLKKNSKKIHKLDQKSGNTTTTKPRFQKWALSSMWSSK
jgi:hypothetical protein